MRPYVAAACLLLALATLGAAARADETSTGDKRRILYSNRFTFNSEGTPLVTIELMSGESQVTLSSDDGVVVQPDGDGGSEVHAGERWSIGIEKARPAVIREWAVVASLAPDDERGLSDTLGRWRRRGYRPRSFETGTVFGIDGEVIDTREVVVAVAPVDAPHGGKRAQEIARKHKIEARVHREIVRRPEGIIVARSGTTMVRNPSVIWFAPHREQGTLTVADVLTGGGGSSLTTRRETRHYFGSIYVTVGSDGKLVVVNAVPADRLLAGLVPSEIFPDASEEALAAQAIAARTELLQKIGTRHLTDPYLLCSSQHCQVYSGAGREHPRTTRAVARTRGLVMLREGGGLVDSRYSASCGGHGEHNEHIWGGSPDPSLRGHTDMPSGSETAQLFAAGINQDNIEDFLSLAPESTYCGATRYAKGRYRWRVRISISDLDKRIAEHYSQVGSVLAMEPVERGVSGRISRLRIRGSRGEVTVSGDLHIRRLLGGLRSSLFTVSAIGDRGKPSAFEIRGAGFGHGVGMCQTGAIGMAEKGMSYPAILRHYYPGTRIKRLY